MTTAIVALLVALTLAAWVVVGLLKLILGELERQTPVLNDVKRLQLNPRTRISKLDLGTGPPTEEQSLRRLGRASVARRVVVGGDPDSSLHEDLTRGIPEEDDNG